MTVIMCVDNLFGLTFNKRRVSRDRAVTEDVIRNLSGRLYMCDKTEPLFEQEEKAVVCEDFLEKAEQNDFCFVENRDIFPYMAKIKRIVLYCWNREYPSDFRFDPALLEGFVLTDTSDFEGISHEKITKKVYEK